MDGNEVVKAIRSIVGENDCRNCMYGSYIIDENSVSMNKSDRGGVYGIAIKLDKGESKEELYHLIHQGKGKFNKTTVEQWKSFEGDPNFYPLYWGKDINLGFRLYEHTKESKTAASVQLSTRGLENRTVIYGAVFCENKEDAEKRLKNEYPDIFQTLTKREDGDL